VLPKTIAIYRILTETIAVCRRMLTKSKAKKEFLPKETLKKK
jgi:hypothetical protein